jgi:outer membrane protein OmpA-like peptidoglycan-associated protein
MQLRSAMVGLALLLPGAVMAQEIEMKVELMGPLGTKTSHKGDRVFARVVQPDGLKGDTVEGAVKEVRSGGKLHGNSVLNFSFETLQHGGQAVQIGTEIRAFRNSKGQAEVDEEGRIIRRGGGNTGKAVAGTAAGGLIGGLAGGLKGAAIGTGVGAAASIAVIEITADSPDIRFDAGSIITLSAKSRNGPALSSLTGAPATAAPAYQPAAPAPAYQPAPAYAANAGAGVPAAPAATVPPANQAAGPAAGAQPDFTALKDDFIPGEKVILYDDFTDMAPDEAPPHWKVRGPAVTLLASGALRQLNVGNRTILTPSIKSYPKNFTLEQDMVCGPKGCQYFWDFFSAKDHNNSALRVAAKTDGDQLDVSAGTNKEALFDTDITINWHAPIKTAIWLQNGRLRVYFNGQKVSDVNQIELPDFDDAHLVVNYFGDGPLGFTRVRFAESTPDFSHTIMSADRYVTHGILFDTGSDRLKPESAAVIKSIAAGLQLNADLKLKIEGHTDSTGDAALNLDLSKRRAAAVKQVLVAEFQIDAARLTTDGLGATKPLEPNDTPQGRAQNRRVEFVKE